MSDPTLEVTKTVLEKWAPLASGVAETVPAVPISVLTGEALDLAYFIAERWETSGGRDQKPGMGSAVASGAINDTIAKDLRELVLAVSHAHAEYRAVTGSTLDAPVERGEFLLAEFKQSLEFIFDDGVTDEQDAELARLTESHTDVSTHDALATSLEGFAFYAAKFRDRLAELPEFDTAFMDEALVVANRLREHSAIKLSSSAMDRQAQQRALRNRLVTLLTDRVAKARRAARFVFRHYPEIAKLAGSTYERKQRARRRIAKQEVENTAPESTSN